MAWCAFGAGAVEPARPGLVGRHRALRVNAEGAMNGGIVTGDWTTLYQWDNQAATFEITSTAACTGGGFTIGPTLTVGVPGTTRTAFVTHVWSCTAISNIIVDFEWYRPDGTK